MNKIEHFQINQKYFITTKAPSLERIICKFYAIIGNAFQLLYIFILQMNTISDFKKGYSTKDEHFFFSSPHPILL